MGNGLLAEWRRRIVARGPLGAMLFAVPVAVAAAIGFGTSLSGVVGGLSAIANGPSRTSTSPQATPRTLNRAVVALADRPASRSSPTAGQDSGTRVQTGAVTGGGPGTGSAGSGAAAVPAISAPDLSLPGSGGTDGAEETVDGTLDSVGGVVDGAGNTVNGILGR